MFSSSEVIKVSGVLEAVASNAIPVLVQSSSTVLSRVIRFFAKTGRYLKLDGARSLKWVPSMPQST